MTDTIRLQAVQFHNTDIPWIMAPGADPEILGLIPGFFMEDDPDDAVAQVNKRYQHGGGWRKMDGFTIENISSARDYLTGKVTLSYEGDPPYRQLAIAMLHDEILILFDCAWLAVVQADGSYEVARLD